MAGVKDATLGSAAKEIVVLSNAHELAAGWVKSMTGGADTDSGEEDQLAPQRLGSRPPRLGLGAKFLPHAQVLATANPVEKKLLVRLNIQSKDTTYGRAFYQQCKKYERHDEDQDDREGDEDELFESRASAFQRRTQQSSQSLLQIDGSQAARKSGRRKKKTSRK